MDEINMNQVRLSCCLTCQWLVTRFSYLISVVQNALRWTDRCWRRCSPGRVQRWASTWRNHNHSSSSVRSIALLLCVVWFVDYFQVSAHRSALIFRRWIIRPQEVLRRLRAVQKVRRRREEGLCRHRPGQEWFHWGGGAQVRHPHTCARTGAQCFRCVVLTWLWGLEGCIVTLLHLSFYPPAFSLLERNTHESSSGPICGQGESELCLRLSWGPWTNHRPCVCVCVSAGCSCRTSRQVHAHWQTMRPRNSSRPETPTVTARLALMVRTLISCYLGILKGHYVVFMRKFKLRIWMLNWINNLF